MAFLEREQLVALGFRHLGENVRISDRAVIYNAPQISIGNNVRIDDFCVLSAGCHGISIGDFIHIAVFCSLIGKEHIALDDFCNLSSRVAIYSSNDDYSGATLTNPTIPDEFKAVQHGKVSLQKHVIVGAGSVILPHVTLGVGVAVGALSLVTRSAPEFSVMAGVPARQIGERKHDLLQMERSFRESLKVAR